MITFSVSEETHISFTERLAVVKGSLAKCLFLSLQYKYRFPKNYLT